MRLGVIAGAVAAAVVVGCGGSAPELEDTTPPSVVSTTPAAAAPSVWVSAPIVVRFSEPIQDTFTATLYAGDAPVPLDAESVELRDSGRELRIAPPRTLELPQNMRLAIAGVVDRFDNPLAGGVDLRWTYPAWIRLGSGGVFGTPCADTPTAVLATPGYPPYAVVRSSNYQVTCMARWNGDAWQRLPDPTGGANVAVGYAAGPGGALAACACREAGPCTMRVYDGNAWQSVGALPPANATQCRPVYRGGVLHAAVRSLATGQYLYRVYRQVSGAWQARGGEVVLYDVRPLGTVADTGSGVAMLIGSSGTASAYTLADGDEEWSSVPSPGTGFSALGAGDGGLLAVANSAARQYSGTTWSNLGVASDVTNLFAVPGVPPVILQFREETGSGWAAWYVSVREWSGGVWRNLGPEQTSGPTARDIAADASGRVFLTNLFDEVSQYNR